MPGPPGRCKTPLQLLERPGAREGGSLCPGGGGQGGAEKRLASQGTALGLFQARRIWNLGGARARSRAAASSLGDRTPGGGGNEGDVRPGPADAAGQSA